MSAQITVTLLVALAVTGFMMAVVPYLTRRTESFGVSIESRHWHDPEIRGMRRKYALGTGSVAVLAILAVLIVDVFFDAAYLVWVLLAVVIAMMITQSGLYLLFHFRMKTLKKSRGLLSSEQQIIAETAFHREKRAVSNWWLLPHLAVAAATAAFCLIFYDRFPDQLVMQYDAQGNPTRVVEKNYGAVLMPVIMQLFMVFTFWLVNYGIASSKQQLDAARPHESLRKNLVFRRRWSAFLLIGGFLLVLAFALMPLQMVYRLDPSVQMAAFTGVTLFMTLGAMILSFMTGQGGSRIRMRGPAGETAAGMVNRDDDRYWKLGVFYYNPEDPAIFIEKRFGVGWTMNWARPAAWALMFGPLVLIFLVMFLLETIFDL